jgi:O-antigen ligase
VLVKTEKFLFTLLAIILPSQLGLHFWPEWSYLFGLRVDFLAPTLYFTDLIVLLLIILKINLFKENYKIWIILTVFALFNIYFSGVPELSLYKWLKVAELTALALYFKNKSAEEFGYFINLMYFALVFYALIGIWQFIKGGTLGGILYWFGERTFNSSTPGIALFNYNGRDFLRAYSTFPHPNSLAGFIVVIIILKLFVNYKSAKSLNLTALLIILICFILTASMGAVTGALFVFFSALLIKKGSIEKLFPGLYIWLTALISVVSTTIDYSKIVDTLGFSKNILERLDLTVISGEIISRYYLTGMGLGTFITAIPTIKGMFTYSWLLQPVHNIYLLILSETGIGGLLILCILLFKLLKRSLKIKNYAAFFAMIFIIFTGQLDHYWFTLQQNMLLVAILMGTSFRK